MRTTKDMDKFCFNKENIRFLVTSEMVFKNQNSKICLYLSSTFLYIIHERLNIFYRLNI